MTQNELERCFGVSRADLQHRSDDFRSSILMVPPRPMSEDESLIRDLVDVGAQAQRILLRELHCWSIKDTSYRSLQLYQNGPLKKARQIYTPTCTVIRLCLPSTSPIVITVILLPPTSISALDPMAVTVMRRPVSMRKTTSMALASSTILG